MRTEHVALLVSLAALCVSTSLGINVQWRKLNGPPVCFGAKGDSFGEFIYRGKILHVWSFMLAYRSGHVSCATNKNPALVPRSHWGCAPHHPRIDVRLTDCKNRVIGPRFSTALPNPQKASYTMQGYNSMSPALVFPMGSRLNQRYIVKTTAELRLWYGEDLLNYKEGDNSGRACADVYGMILV